MPAAPIITRDSIKTLSWPYLCDLTKRIIRARDITFSQFAAELGKNDRNKYEMLWKQVHKLQSVKPESAAPVAAWCRKHFAALSK